MDKRERVMKRLMEHAAAAELLLMNENRIAFIALQGSQNYGLDYEGSDIDTKCVVLPTFDEIVDNRKPVSLTHIMENEEHCDVKDIRLMFDCYKKQNVNFVETLFTDYIWINPMYKEEVEYLLSHREDIARYCPYRAVKCMKGMVLEKRHALQHPYPNKIATLEQYGYDPKQLHHIVRLYDFMVKYTNENSYKDCLVPSNKEFILDLKTKPIPETQAISLADEFVRCSTFLADYYCDHILVHPTIYNEAEKVLHATKHDIIKKYLKTEIAG